MSPDRTTTTRAEAIRQRKEEEQRRREKNVPLNIGGQKSAASSGLGSISRPKRSVSPQPAPVTPGRLRRRYDLVSSTPYSRGTSASASKPKRTLTLPQIRVSPGPRWISMLVAIACTAVLYLLTNSDPFIIRQATILGAERLNPAEIENALGARNQAAALINPAQIEYNLLVSYPDIETAKVEINAPANVVVTIKERKPVAAWEQDGQTVWVDAKGYAFAPHGNVSNLVTITSTGVVQAPASDAEAIGAKPFLPENLAQAISTLSTSLPEGTSMVYDPQYGLGWNDPNGWKVYFGHSNGDASLKLKVYQAIVKYLGEQNLQPTLISVEYPNAPFYRAEPLEQ